MDRTLEGREYRRILVGIDGSEESSHAAAASLSLAAVFHAEVTGCHVYAARLHESRFSEMEPGLPQEYKEHQRLGLLRTTHDSLISKGMKIISDAYLSPFAQEASKKGVPWDSVTPEGRNYVEVMRLIKERKPDLVALGFSGMGKRKGIPGSMTLRTILGCEGCDFLVSRAPFSPEGHPLVIGVDGSPDSYRALLRGATLGAALGMEVHAVAAYDPDFHSGVFRTISTSLPDETRSRFDFSAQERLHDGIINSGLSELYGSAVERSAEVVRKGGIPVKTCVLAGKPHEALSQYAQGCDAALVVVGRFGLHRDKGSLLGSTGFSLLLSEMKNLLVVSGPADPPEQKTEGGNGIVSMKEAEDILEGIPRTERPLVRSTVERQARIRGIANVRKEQVQECQGDREKPLSPDRRPGQRAACEVTFRKLKRFAPDFHRHILKNRIQGRVVSVGDRILVYEVVETVPPGPVTITGETVFEFR